MSDALAEVVVMPDDRRLWGLAVGQVVSGMVATLLAPARLPDLVPYGLEHILIVPFLASAMAQAVLLAVWAVASGSSPWSRLGNLAVGVAYLELLLAMVGIRGEFGGLAIAAIAVVASCLLVATAVGIRFARGNPGVPADPHGPGGPRFSIRGLMILTAAVALLGAGARALPGSRLGYALIGTIWACCFGAAGLAALWAGLGEPPPFRRGAIAFVVSPVLGAFVAYAADTHRSGWFYIIATMILYPAILLASLMVVRSCGYRAVGPSTESPRRWIP